MSPYMPPFGFEYKIPSRKSPEKDAGGENYDYEGGPLSIKVYTCLMMGNMHSGDVNRSAYGKFDLYNNIMSFSGMLLRLSGEYWTQEYSSYRARYSDGSVNSSCPLLDETRKVINADLHIGSMVIAPVLDIKPKTGMNIHYEYFSNTDDFEGYNDYTWHRGWLLLAYDIDWANITGRYEYHVKNFSERTVSSGSDKRNDRFHVIRGDLNLYLNHSLTLSAQYAYTDAESNEDLVYINYNKHYTYLKAVYFLDSRF